MNNEEQNLNNPLNPKLGISGVNHSYASKEDLMRQIIGNKQMLNLAEHNNEPETTSKFKLIITELEELLVNYGKRL
jgi:hypothetical protein